MTLTIRFTAFLPLFTRSDVTKYFPLLAGRVKITLIEATDKILGEVVGIREGEGVERECVCVC